MKLPRQKMRLLKAVLAEKIKVFVSRQLRSLKTPTTVLRYILPTGIPLIMIR